MSSELKKISDLEKILSITMELSYEGELHTLLELIMAKAKEIIPCERTTIFLIDQKNQELWSLLTSELEIKEIRFPLGVGIAGQVASTNEIINIVDAYSDSRFNPSFDLKTGFRTKTILTLPLRSLHGKVVGVLQMLNRIEETVFHEYDIFIMQTFANQVGVILERADLIKSRIAEERLSNEMELASRIQKKLLPERTERFEHLEINGWNVSCDETGGDYFDFFQIENNQTLIAVGDVSGHGISAALIMLEARALFKAFSFTDTSVGEILNRINYFLHKDLETEKFMTFFLGCFDKSGKKFQYSSAGHDGPLWFKSKTEEILQLDSTGTVLGFMEGIEFPSSDVLDVEINDIFVFFTDGVFESKNEHGEQFGKNKLVDCIKRNRTLSAEGLSKIIKQELQDFCGNQNRQDDITLVVAKMT